MQYIWQSDRIGISKFRILGLRDSGSRGIVIPIFQRLQNWISRECCTGQNGHTLNCTSAIISSSQNYFLLFTSVSFIVLLFCQLLPGANEGPLVDCVTKATIVLQEDASDCGRACGLVRPTVLFVVLLTALTLAVTILVVDGSSSVHWPTPISVLDELVYITRPCHGPCSTIDSRYRPNTAAVTYTLPIIRRLSMNLERFWQFWRTV